MEQSLGYRDAQLPVTESMSKRLLRLRFFYELTPQEIDLVADLIYDFFGVTPVANR